MQQSFREFPDPRDIVAYSSTLLTLFVTSHRTSSWLHTFSWMEKHAFLPRLSSSACRASLSTAVLDNLASKSTPFLIHIWSSRSASEQAARVEAMSSCRSKHAQLQRSLKQSNKPSSLTSSSSNIPVGAILHDTVPSIPALTDTLGCLLATEAQP